jgi:3-ketoacyl-CoA synthase
LPQLELATLYQQGDLSRLWSVASQTDLTFNLVSFGLCCALLVAVAATYAATRSRPVYLLGYSCYKGGADRKATYAWFMEHSRTCGIFDQVALDFQEKVLERSGLGEETYLPKGARQRQPGARWERGRRRRRCPCCTSGVPRAQAARACLQRRAGVGVCVCVCV